MKELRKKRNASKLAWLLSFGIHVVIGVLAFFVTWSVINLNNKKTVATVSQWHELEIVEEAKFQVKPDAAKSKENIDIDLSLISADPVLTESRGLVAEVSSVDDGFQVVDSIKSGKPIPAEAKRQPNAEAKFMGLDAIGATKIVYVVDASGSMLTHFSSILNELKRSLSELHTSQSFGIIFFQLDKAIVVPPENKLQPAEIANINQAFSWIAKSGHVIPCCSSNPIAAINAAFELNPDTIYLLSENIKGAGHHEISEVDLLEELMRLNPIVDLETEGRAVQINCIQYLTQEPGGTMQRIGAIHGGDDGYTFLSRGTVSK